MIIKKQDYRNYLIEFKNKNHSGAPATDEEYVKWWEEAIEETVKDFYSKGGEHTMLFSKYQKDGPLLTLTRDGKIPEKYQVRIEAYKIYGKDLGYDVNYVYNKLENGCIECNIKITKE